MLPIQAAGLRKEVAVKTILVPLDGSPLAEQVLPYVQTLAPILDARVLLLRVVTDLDDESVVAESVATTYGAFDPLVTRERLQRSRDTLRQNAEGDLYSQAMLLRGSGLDVDYEVGFGAAAELILETATKHHVTLIAMATHGRSGLQRWTLGSVADKVTHAANTPILMIRGAAQQPAQNIAFKRILVPLDGSPFARQAIPFAAELATCAQATLLLMEAVPPTLEAHPGLRPLGRPVPQLVGMIGEMRELAQQELGALADDLRQRGLAVAPIVASGYAAEAIVDVATQRQSDLIVMATHGRSGLRRWTLGSIADKVLHATTTPLVLIRAQNTSG
jgi:nucleotide-binding universal stress UspA family protein